jgi:amino acid adenylation domain-containing protein
MSSQSLERTDNPAVRRLRTGIEKLTATAATPRIELAAPDASAPFPLTEMQEAYWIGRQDGFSLGGTAIYSYHETELPNVDLRRLQDAWHRLVQRHDMLRAVITEDGRQRVLDRVTVPALPVEDLRELPAAERDARLTAIRDAMSHRLQPLGTWPLWEIRATRLDDGLTRIHVGIDGIVIDDRSYQILIREWLLLYQDGRDLPSLELSFRDYLRKERELRETPAYQRSLQYWRQRIKSLPAAPQLPLASDPQQLERPRFKRKQAKRSTQQWGRLREICTQRGVRPPTLLLAAFIEVLARWSNEPELTVSVPTLNRLPLHPQVNDIVGEFGSFVLIGNEGLTEATFGERLSMLQERLWESFDHAQVSGVRVLRELSQATGAVERARMPVVFTMASSLNRVTKGDASATQEANVLFGITQTPQVLIDHQASEIRGELHFNWDVVEAAFPPGMIDDMFAAYCTLLDRIAEDDSVWHQRCATRLPDWQLDERREANATTAGLTDDLLHAALDHVTQQAPERVAIITSARSLSFGELDLRAAAVAELLADHGVQPGEIIAVVAEKGWEQVAAVLGILRAGAVYLPVGADLPPPRRHRLLTDAAVRIAMTPSALLPALQWPAGVRALAIPDTGPRRTIRRAPQPAKPDDPAYVLYTSGSTGAPKGVVLSHRAAVNTISDISTRFRVTGDDRVLGLSQLSFDLSVYDIFGVLGAGGALVLPSPAEATDPMAWAMLCRRFGATIWNSVPALLSIFVQYLEDTDERLPAQLRLALLSGDWIPLELPARVNRRRGAPLALASLGGATEAAIWSVWSPIGEPRPGWASIPYGRPLTNQRLHVLGRDMQDCPVWVAGRLYIEGAGLAIGYLNDPQRTEEKFVFDTLRNVRLYDTGDIARYRPGGDIEFLGRADRQVKINGHRIELREIEASLLEFPEVRSVVVLAEDGGRLAAFVVPRQPGAAIGAAVREFAQSQLPRHLVPQRFVCIERLPLSRDGKVDVAALQQRHGASATQSVTPEAGQVTEHLAALIRQVGLGEVDATRSLIELGANSMQMIRLSSLIRRDFGVEIPLVDLLSIENLAALSARVAPPAIGLPPRAATVEADSDPLESQLATPPGLASTAETLRRLQRASAGAAVQLVREPRREARAAAYVARTSCRRFSLRQVSARTLGRLLEPLAGEAIEDAARFRYGSVSSLYAVQLYCEVKPGRVAGMLPGLYFYHPLRHCLIERTPAVQVDRAHYGPQNRRIADEAAFTLFFVCSLSSMQPIYGRHSLALAMYEAGSMGQLLRETAADLELGLCSIGSMEFAGLHSVLGLAERDVFLHAIVGGRIAHGDDVATGRDPDATQAEQLLDLAERVLQLDAGEAASVIELLESRHD